MPHNIPELAFYSILSTGQNVGLISRFCFRPWSLEFGLGLTGSIPHRCTDKSEIWSTPCRQISHSSMQRIDPEGRKSLNRAPSNVNTIACSVGNPAGDEISIECLKY